MHRIFKDPGLQTQFEQEGFLKIPLLTQEDVATLKNFYSDHAKSRNVTTNTAYGMVVSLDFEEHKDKYKTIEQLRNVVLPRANLYFQDFETHLGSFIVKHPDPASVVYPHSDWTFIDKQNNPEYFTLTLWIALGDYDRNQGSLGIVKGSSRFFPGSIRCSPQPTASTPVQGHELLLSEYISFPELKAGDAIAFNNDTYHASLPNVGDGPRFAATIGVRPAGAPLHHYTLVPGKTDRMLKLLVNEEFYMNYGNAALKKLWENGELPKHCSVVEELPYNVTNVSSDGIENLCREAGNKKADSLFKQFFQ